MIGQTGRCPSCGAQFEVPRPGLGWGTPVGEVDPGQVEGERIPVHAYAAAGERAPRIVTRDDGSPGIECPRCGESSDIDAERCGSCGRPFTMEGAVRAAPPAGQGRAVLCFVMGLLAVPVALCGGGAGALPAAVSLGLGWSAWPKTRPGRGPARPLIITGVLHSSGALATIGYFMVRFL